MNQPFYMLAIDGLLQLFMVKILENFYRGKLSPVNCIVSRQDIIKDDHDDGEDGDGDGDSVLFFGLIQHNCLKHTKE